MPHLSDKTYLGIDPGKSGGLAIVCGKQVLETYVMPESPLDLWNHFSLIFLKYEIDHCFLEKVHSMPNDGHTGAFTFGRGFGALEMALAAIGFPHEQITPQRWQKVLDIPTRKPTEPRPKFKDRLRMKAQELFPRYEMWSTPKTVTKQRAIADAILIAEACRRSQQAHKSSEPTKRTSRTR